MNSKMKFNSCRYMDRTLQLLSLIHILLAARPEVCGRMVDVGTGAGFPGIVAKLFRPELDLTLMERCV